MYQQAYDDDRINIVYALFHRDTNPGEYEEYYNKYPISNPAYKVELYKEVKVLKILTDEELIEMGYGEFITKKSLRRSTHV